MYGHRVTSPAVSERYWCDEDSDTFAKEYFSRIKGQQAGGFLSRLQRLAFRHFYGALPSGYVGDMPSSGEVQRSGDQGQNVDLRVNWLRAHANAKHQIIVAPKLAWGCQAGNTDSRSMADASRGATILEAEWKRGPYEQQAIAAMLSAIISSEKFVFTYWQSTAGKQSSFTPEVPATNGVEAQPAKVEYEGDIRSTPVATWDVFRDGTAKSWEGSPWKSVQIATLRWDLIAQYPGYREEILSAPSAPATQMLDGTGAAITVSNDDKVMCHYFFHERTPALPTGLQAVLLSPECVMQFEKLEPCYFVCPIHKFSAGDLEDSPWSYTDFWEAMASQNLATDIQGSLATNIVAFGKQIISAESDANLPIDQIGNGPMVIYRKPGSEPPSAIQLSAQPESAFKHLDSLKADQRLALGLNDVSMGEAPTGAPNAQAWALLATATVTANSGPQRSWVKGVQSMARSILEIFKEKVSVARKTAVVGVHGASVPKQEEWDKSDFEGFEDVTIEIANPLMQTAAGRIQIHDMYKAAGFIQTPEQLAMVVETGQLNPLTQILRNELILIAWENEEILQGRPPPVKISDSHQMHIREHRDPTFNPVGRASPEVNAAADKHINDHLNMLLSMDPRTLAIFGQAAPPAPPPPAGAPGAESKPGAPMSSPFGEQQGVKLPTAPVNPATSAPAAPPGIPS